MHFPAPSKRFLALPLVIVGLVLGAVQARGEEASKKATADLSWSDVRGHKYGETDITQAKATVFLFSSTQCPISNAYTPRMIQLAKDFTPRGVRFFLVNSNVQDRREAVARYAKERGFPFPAVKDDGTALADRLGAQATPEAIIVDASGVVRYMGRIDDNQDVARVVRQDAREALEALLAGRPVARARTLTIGCAIFREKPAALTAAASKESVTYTRDVARILNENCVMCHRTGEVAPFSLESYEQARTWAQQIKEYTGRRLMPPWKAVTEAGEFHDMRRLSDAQIATLARWSDGGAPKGNMRDLPPPPRFPAPDAWALGTPDVEAQPARAYHLAAEGRDVYRNFVLPVDFTEDRYVSAMEFKPGNRAVVHHIVAYLDPMAASVKLDGKDDEPGYTVPGVGPGIPNAMWGDVWVPGSLARFLPPGIALRIPKGAKIVLQVHYHKTGKPETDQTRVGLYYAKEKPQHEIITFPIGRVDFQLAAGSAREEVRASLTLPIDAQVWNVFPHMHMLGREMKATATLPDGKVQNLVSVNDWDFNWQATYHYRQPVTLPKGTRLDLVATYDNSEKNPRQTAHPPTLVRFGEQTTDEMCFCFFGITADPAGLRALGAAVQRSEAHVPEYDQRENSVSTRQTSSSMLLGVGAPG